jgi:hypothetical protein
MSKNAYKPALIAALVLILGPVVLGIVLIIPHLIFLSSCNAAAHCEQGIAGLVTWLEVGLVVFAPFAILLGGMLLLALGVFYGIGAAKARGGTGQLRRLIAGAVCIPALPFLLYVPASPDECSRSLTDVQYETCLKGVFADMTTAEVFSWLQDNGYQVPLSLSRAQDYARDAGVTTVNVQTIRDYGHYRSVPYGTNFNRLFVRIGPAPEHFELNLEADMTTNKVSDIEVWWAFEFL